MNESSYVYRTGLLNGILIGVVVTAFYCVYLRDRGREECEVKLLRSEQCVQVWAPQTKEKK
jgi:hypothetical protein